MVFKNSAADVILLQVNNGQHIYVCECCGSGGLSMNWPRGVLLCVCSPRVANLCNRNIDRTRSLGALWASTSSWSHTKLTKTNTSLSTSMSLMHVSVELWCMYLLWKYQRCMYPGCMYPWSIYDVPGMMLVSMMNVYRMHVWHIHDARMMYPWWIHDACIQVAGMMHPWCMHPWCLYPWCMYPWWMYAWCKYA